MIYPDAAGPIWIPALTPEGSPRSGDNRNTSDRSLQELRTFATPPSSPTPFPILQALDIEPLRQFGTSSSKHMSAPPYHYLRFISATLRKPWKNSVEHGGGLHHH